MVFRARALSPTSSASPIYSPGRSKQATSSKSDHETEVNLGGNATARRQVAGHRAAARVSAAVLRDPVAHHGAGVVPHPGRIRRTGAALRGGKARSQPRQLRTLFQRIDLRPDLREVGVVRARYDAVLPRARVPARRADRQIRQTLSGPAAIAGYSAVLEQF